MSAGKTGRLAFYRSFSERKGAGYQQYSDTSLPVCWLERMLAIHFTEIETSIQDPDFARDVFQPKVEDAPQPPVRFILDRDAPSFRTEREGKVTPLVPGKYVQEYARNQARTLEELLAETAPFSRLVYLSQNGRGHHSGMRFSVTARPNGIRRFFLKEVDFSAEGGDVFEAHPDLETLVLAKLQEVANSYTDEMLQGFRDDCLDPYSWQRVLRSKLYLLPEDVFTAAGSTKFGAIHTAESEIAKSSQTPYQSTAPSASSPAL